MKEKTIWVLVEVRSGIPTSVKTFSSEEFAKEKERELRETLNLENDETGVFQLPVPEGKLYAMQQTVLS